MSRRHLGGERKRLFRNMILGYRSTIPCHYCGCHLDRITMTLDHVVPLSKGGSKGFKNIVPSCKKCNMAKGDKDYASFVRRITA